MHLIYMRDYLTLIPKQVELGKKLFNECADATEKSGKSLLVTVEGTHAGIINGNMRLYRPDRMQESTHTWVEAGKPAKPVLVEHDKDDTAVGRILRAKYFDLSHMYRDDVPEIGNMVFFADAVGKRIDLFKSINIILDKLQPRDDYKGLGYIELGMKITNPDAIRKVLNDEYLTVSVGFSTDQAICSACHTDWAVDDRCEHKLGELVDGKKMFLIAGNFFYKECSFVNFPADPFAQVTSKEILKDSINKMFFMGLSASKQTKILGSVKMADSLELADVYESDIQVVHDSEDTKEMLVELQKFLDEMNAAPLTKERAKEIFDQVQALSPEQDSDKEMKRRVVTTLKSHMQQHGLMEEVKPVLTKDQVEAKIETLIPTLQDMTVEARTTYLARITEEAKPFGLEVPTIDVDSLEAYKDWKVEDLPEAERAFFADPEALYELMFTKADTEDAIKAEDTEFGELLVDAKLSSEKRKSLKGSTFCGPGRSFPVPDCAHVTAARRLIGRAKVSDSTKSKILGCVSRKAKALGCSGKAESKDSITTLLADLHKVEMFSFDDAKIPADTLECMDTLHGHYHAADEKGKHLMRYDLYTHLGYWNSAAEKESIHGRLKSIETESKDAITDAKAPLMVIGSGLATEVGKGFVPKGAASAFDAMSKAHQAADAEGKSHITSAAGALLEHWHSGSILEYHRAILAPGTGQTMKDHVLIPKEEHNTLLTAHEKLETRLTDILAELDVAKQQNIVLVKNLKKDRATTLVAIKVLTGEASFQGLSHDQIQEKVTERSQRNLDSLKDSLEDELIKLAGFVFQGAAPKSEEIRAKEVSDATKLPNPDAPNSMQDSTTQVPNRRLPRDPKLRAAFEAYHKVGTSVDKKGSAN